MDNLSLYLAPFLFALVISLALMRVLIALGNRYEFFDPAGGRKRHAGNISRLGGAGIIAAFWTAVFLSGSLEFDRIKVGLFVSSLLILAFGLRDDRRSLGWKEQLLFQLVIGLLMLSAGLGVEYIANPWGGSEFRLDGIILGGVPVLGVLFILLWVAGFMNVVNWLDGMDGLAGGVGVIASVTLFFLSVGALVNQPPLGVLAAALAGSLAGFLVFNSHPARIFMGTSGAYFLGFMLAALAVFAGGKIATLFLVMGFPILDAFWVVVKRLREGRSPFAGDRSHLQYNLLDRGWSERETVLFIYLLSGLSGLLALLFQGMDKFVALLALGILALVVTARLKFRRPGADLTERGRSDIKEQMPGGRAL